MPRHNRRLQWGPQYFTGIKSIDEQHRVLFDLINELEDALAGTVNAAIIAQALQAVASYALYHFVTEERLAMKSGMVGNMAGHFAQHQDFNRRVAGFRDDQATGDIVELGRDLLRYLKHWLTHHILRTDMELARALRGEPPAPEAEGESTPVPMEETRRLRVAIVEDNRDLREELVFYLSHAGYHAIGLSDGAGLRRLMATSGCDVIVLDLGLPDVDGIDLARAFGNREDIAIVMLTARGAADDRIAGYLCGADAYLVKPVDMRELVVVVERVAKRLAAFATRDGDAAWHFHPARWLLVSPSGESIHLTAQQQALMQLFANAGGNVIARDELAAALHWESDSNEDQKLEASISRLRRKLEVGGGEAPLKAARGAGYVFAAPLQVIS